MRSEADVREVFRLTGRGLSLSEVSRRTSVSRSQIRKWLAQGLDSTLRSPMRTAFVEPARCPSDCPRREGLDAGPYAYLLGQYLGDGCLSRIGRVHKLRITCCDAYPRIMTEVEQAMLATLARRVGRQQRTGCTEVGSLSRHWPCILPQHGPGRKHLRPIALEPWQVELALRQQPGMLLRGLVHSDGWRGTNRVVSRGKRYEYSRYLFKNESADIRAIFAAACDALGVECRPNARNSMSVARRASVERLDRIVGPKS